jgi:hypothetical protein
MHHKTKDAFGDLTTQLNAMMAGKRGDPLAQLGALKSMKAAAFRKGIHFQKAWQQHYDDTIRFMRGIEQ